MVIPSADKDAGGAEAPPLPVRNRGVAEDSPDANPGGRGRETSDRSRPAEDTGAFPSANELGQNENIAIDATLAEDVDVEKQLQERLDRERRVLEENVTRTILGNAAEANVLSDESEPNPNRKKWYILGLIIILSLAAVGAALGVVLSRDNAEKESSDAVITNPPFEVTSEAPSPGPSASKMPSSDPSNSPTETPTQDPRISALTRKLAPVLTVGEDHSLLDPNSHEYRAFYWLLDEDPMNLDVIREPPLLLRERFMLVHLYYSTNGESWNDQLNFLSNSSVCEWNDGFEGIVPELQNNGVFSCRQSSGQIGIILLSK
jgi:hypothetical protein